MLIGFSRAESEYLPSESSIDSIPVKSIPYSNNNQAAVDPKNIVRRKLTGYVGFANLPNQWHRKSVRKGFNFNVMVVGMFHCFCCTLLSSEELSFFFPLLFLWRCHQVNSPKAWRVFREWELVKLINTFIFCLKPCRWIRFGQIHTGKHVIQHITLPTKRTQRTISRNQS